MAVDKEHVKRMLVNLRVNLERELGEARKCCERHCDDLVVLDVI